MLKTQNTTYKMPGMCQTWMFQCRSCAGSANKLRPAVPRRARSGLASATSCCAYLFYTLNRVINVFIAIVIGNYRDSTDSYR